MAEATVLTAQANVTFPNWKQLASNIIDLGNAWMRVSASNHTQEAAVGFSKTIARRLEHIASGLQNLYFSSDQNENGLEEDALCMPIDVFVQVTTAVERLLAMAGSCANVYKPPAGGSNFDYVTPPSRPAIEAAAVLSSFCNLSIPFPKFDPQACESMWKKAIEASLGALETAAKTASLLFSSLTPEQQHLLLKDGRLVNSGVTSETNISHVLYAQISMLTFLGDILPSEQGRLFVACGFLTLTQACAMLGRPVQGSWGMPIEFLAPLLHYTRGDLLECLLKSDGSGFACLHSAAEIVPDELTSNSEKHKLSVAMLQNLLETYIPNIDDKDPVRLKLRAQVLGLRGCGNIKCTTLRPSSKKSIGKLCAGCQSVRFCGAKCQKADWKGNHKGACKQFQAEAAA